MVQRKGRGWPLQQNGTDTTKCLTMQQRHSIFQRSGSGGPVRATAAEVQPAINRALHQEGVPAFIRVLYMKRNDKKTLTGITTPLASAEKTLTQKDMMVRQAHTRSGSHWG